jgi:hypothetical protein
VVVDQVFELRSFLDGGELGACDVFGEADGCRDKVGCMDDGCGDVGPAEELARFEAMAAGEELVAVGGGAECDRVDEAVGGDLVAESGGGGWVRGEAAVSGVGGRDSGDRDVADWVVGRGGGRRRG